jgi:hypothetical protein
VADLAAFHKFGHHGRYHPVAALGATRGGGKSSRSRKIFRFALKHDRPP